MQRKISEICNLELNISFEATKKINKLNKFINILERLFVNKLE